MTRELSNHKVNECNDQITVVVADEKGSGGAHHVYDIVYDAEKSLHCLVKFQDGPIAEVGTNGVTQEALLAIVEDRLKCFQDGPYACRENAIALEKVQEAMHWLHHRTRARVARGVEGTHAV